MTNHPANLRKNPLTGSRSIPLKTMDGGANVELPEGTKREFTVVTDHLTRGQRPFRFTELQWRTYQQLPLQGYSHRWHLESVFNEWLASRLTREKIAITLAKKTNPRWDELPGEMHLAMIHSKYGEADAILALMVEGEK